MGSMSLGAEDQLDGKFRSLLHWIICLTFIAAPLNPYVGGITVYLWLPLSLLDFRFWKRARTYQLSGHAIWTFLAAATWLLLIGQYGLLAKLCALTYGVFYFIKNDEVLTRKLFAVGLISAAVAVVQFAVYLISPAAAYVIGPTSLSQFLWRNLATPTFTNQFAVYGLPRMSGLSREAGFFATTLATTILLWTTLEGPKARWQKGLLGLAVLFSVSKATLMLLLLPLLLQWRQWLDRVPRITVIAGFIGAAYVAGAVVGIEHPEFYKNEESLAHRFSSAQLIKDMTLEAHLLGCDDTFECIQGPSANLAHYLEDITLTPNTGIAGVWVTGGAISFALLILFITGGLGLSSTAVAILCVLTITTSPLTMDGFIYMMYIYLIRQQQRLSAQRTAITADDAPAAA